MAIARKEKKRLGDILVASGVISKEQLSEALSLQRNSGGLLGDILVNGGFVTEDDILKAIQKQMRIPKIDLNSCVIPEKVIRLYNNVVEMKKSTFIPYNFEEGVLYIAMSNPLNTEVIDLVSIACNCHVAPAVAKAVDIAAAIDKYYGSEQVRLILDEIEDQNIIRDSVEEETTEDDDTPIIKLVNSFFEQAVHLRASDIHIEPLEKSVRVRYRVDGDLMDSGTSYQNSLLNAIISRIKVLGGMNIAEKRRPQDGRITQVIDGVEFDVRVSILPSSYGEKVVMRLTNKDKLTMDKSELGLLPEDELKFDDLLKNSHGIILVTGPTGSGKSTTLYTALSELNKINVNITTIEDPVEANIDGLTQVQINDKAGLTFPVALRTFLRQDPDIIMVGEIRDAETANLAIDAALTGHLVVSTLHTNNSVSTISRLEKMGIEPYLLADALVGVLAQRLVKRLCECKKPYNPSHLDRMKLNLKPNENVQLYKPCGCVKCNNTGYHGRIGVYEILPLTDRLKNMIADERPISEIEATAMSEGLSTLRLSCQKLIKMGITTVSEMDRIVHDNSVYEDVRDKKLDDEEIIESDTVVEEVEEVMPTFNEMGIASDFGVFEDDFDNDFGESDVYHFN